MPKPRPFNPETDVPVCFMSENPNGLILSRSHEKAPIKQYAPACDVSKGLPRPSSPESHSLTTDTRVVTCPDCQKTSVFLEAFKKQNNKNFQPIPVDDVMG